MSFKRKVLLIMLFLTAPLLKAEKTPMVTGRKLGDGNWGTHMPVLVTAVMNTNGPVLELGCGDYSTPLLHAICMAQNRYLLTTESDKQWQSLFLDLDIENRHDFRLVKNFDDWDNVGGDKHWSVIFIDHAPYNRRILDIKRLRNNTEIFVIHDAEQPGYGYEPYVSSFKYKFVYKRYKHQTMIVSDTINVAKLFEE